MRLRFESRSLRLVLAGAITILGLVIGDWWLSACGLGLAIVIGLNRIWSRHYDGGFAGPALGLLAIGVGLAALLAYVLMGSAVPKGTSVPLALIGLIPVGLFTYLGFAVAYRGSTGRRPPGVDGLMRVVTRLNRPL